MFICFDSKSLDLKYRYPINGISCRRFKKISFYHFKKLDFKIQIIMNNEKKIFTVNTLESLRYEYNIVKLIISKVGAWGKQTVIIKT